MPNILSPLLHLFKTTPSTFLTSHLKTVPKILQPRTTPFKTNPINLTLTLPHNPQTESFQTFLPEFKNKNKIIQPHIISQPTLPQHVSNKSTVSAKRSSSTHNILTRTPASSTQHTTTPRPCREQTLNPATPPTLDTSDPQPRTREILDLAPIQERKERGKTLFGSAPQDGMWRGLFHVGS